VPPELDPARSQPDALARRVVIVVARNEADRIADTLGAVAAAFPGARVIVADGGSRDATAEVAAEAGSEVVLAGRAGGKGGAATRVARRLLGPGDRVGPRPGGAQPVPTTFVLCDGDLGASAARLAPLAEAVERGDCDLAVAAFARRQGGGVGLAVGFARWAIRDLAGVETRAPISGQRALRAEVLEAVLPFAHGFGMETGMTADAVRAGFGLAEIELDLEHRATGRSVAGFVHRGRQLADFVRAWLARKVPRR
jgi:glycosyltransferase involved in cell wall biosynthesis